LSPSLACSLTRSLAFLTESRVPHQPFDAAIAWIQTGDGPDIGV
jgi:hypothetical protein